MGESNDREIKLKVAEFWDGHPCGSFASDKSVDEVSFFEEVESHRYRAQPFMHGLFDFERFSGLRVLEVGCGLGTDLRQAAMAGARTVGLDLSAKSVSLARSHFRMFRTEGAFVCGDAESLPFPDESFDVVYSFGVLHHTPNTSAAIKECHRVLRPGGRFLVMLYNRCSWHVRVGPYLLALKRWIYRQPAPVGGTDRLQVVRRYDGADNPLGTAFTPTEVRGFLQSFDDIQLHIRHPRVVGGGLSARAYERALEWAGVNSRWGFWIVAQAHRPAKEKSHRVIVH